MEITKINIGNTEYSFANETWDRSNSWGHRTILFINGYQVQENHCRYYNRTWERYTYQSCMKQTVSNLIDEKLDDYIDDFKQVNSINRLKSGQEDEIEAMFENEDEIMELRELLQAL